MSEEGMETFEVQPGQPTEETEKSPKRRAPVADKRVLHVTVVDHTPIIEDTDEASYIDLRIPLDMAEAGLKMVPQGKLGEIDPELVVQMVAMGSTGELVKIDNDKKSISIRVE